MSYLISFLLQEVFTCFRYPTQLMVLVYKLNFKFVLQCQNCFLIYIIHDEQFLKVCLLTLRDINNLDD
jgi:hypothetical protein